LSPLSTYLLFEFVKLLLHIRILVELLTKAFVYFQSQHLHVERQNVNWQIAFRGALCATMTTEPKRIAVRITEGKHALQHQDATGVVIKAAVSDGFSNAFQEVLRSP